MLSQSCSEMPILIGQLLLVVGSIAVNFLEPQDFILKGFDVKLLSLAMCPLRR